MKRNNLPLALLSLLCVMQVQAQIKVTQKDLHSSTVVVEHDVTQLEKAITMAKELSKAENKYVEVLLSEGVYRLSKGINLDNCSRITIKGEDKNKVFIKGSVELKKTKPLSKSHALYKANPEIGKQIVEIDLSNIPHLGHDKFRLAGFSGSDTPKHYTLNELHFNGNPMQLSRYPNEGYIKYDTFVSDTTQGGERIGIKYNDNKISSWINEPNILLHGYWKWLWADAYESVSQINTKDSILWLEPPYNHYKFRDNRPFAAVNVIMEIDSPGEYAYDYTSKKIYFYPPTPLNDANIELSICKDALFSLNNAKDITLENISFSASSSTGIEIIDSEHVTLKSNIIYGVARDAVVIKDGKHNQLLDCEVYETGRGAFRVDCGSYETLESSHLLIADCHAHNLSRIDKTYTPGIYVEGVGVHIRNCLFNDIPSSAIRLDGNDHLVEYNEFTRCVTESDDQGAIDMWGTPNYRGNVIRYNYFHHNGPQSTDNLESLHGRAGIRFDDTISEVMVYGNVFNNSSKGAFGAIQIHGGKKNFIWNNLFFDCDIAVSFAHWGEDHWINYTYKSKEFFLKHRGLYISKYPDLLNYDQDLNQNTIVENIFYNCDKTDRNRGEARNIWEHNVEINNPEVNQFIPELVTNLEVTVNSVLFNKIPFSKIGLKKNPTTQF